MKVQIYKPSGMKFFIYADDDIGENVFNGETVIWELSENDFDGHPIITDQTPLSKAVAVLSPIADKKIREHLYGKK